MCFLVASIKFVETFLIRIRIERDNNNNNNNNNIYSTANGLSPGGSVIT